MNGYKTTGNTERKSGAGFAASCTNHTQTHTVLSEIFSFQEASHSQ